ncbi:MAG: hypothetical protein KDH93_14975 [Rhodoferax sp.]|nr:hypothetical protein [Rhodoferax sp.]MCP5233897.1 hypothetical protein [Zoogloeaceae bacterium]
MKAKHKRLFWSVTLPPLALLFAVLLAELTRWLDQSAGGRMVLMCALALVCAIVGRMAWRWPGWTDDDPDA